MAVCTGNNIFDWESSRAGVCCPDDKWTKGLYVQIKGWESLRFHNEFRTVYALALLLRPIEGNQPAIYTIAWQHNLPLMSDLEKRLRKAYDNFQAAFPQKRWRKLEGVAPARCETNLPYSLCCGPWSRRFAAAWPMSASLMQSIFGMKAPTIALLTQWYAAVDNVIKLVPSGGVDRAYGPMLRNVNGTPPPNIAPLYLSCGAGGECKEQYGEFADESTAWYTVNWESLPGEEWRQKGYQGIPEDLLQVQGGHIVPSSWLNALLDLLAYPHGQILYEAPAMQIATTVTPEMMAVLQPDKVAKAVEPMAVKKVTTAKLAPYGVPVEKTISPTAMLEAPTITAAPVPVVKTFSAVAESISSPTVAVETIGVEEPISRAPVDETSYEGIPVDAEEIGYLDPGFRAAALEALKSYVVIQDTTPMDEGEKDLIPLAFTVMLKSDADTLLIMKNSEFVPASEGAPNALDYLTTHAKEKWGLAFCPFNPWFEDETNQSEAKLQYKIVATSTDDVSRAMVVASAGNLAAINAKGFTMTEPFAQSPYIFSKPGDKWKEQAADVEGVSKLKTYAIYGAVGAAALVGGYFLLKKK